MSDGATKKKSKSTFHFAAGLASGTVSAVLLQPIDLLKTRVQQSGGSSLTTVLRDIRASPRVIPALWRGAVPSALRTGFGSAIYFTTLNKIRDYTARKIPSLAISPLPVTRNTSSSSTLPKLSHIGNLVAGATARTSAGMLLMPLTIIKVRYESNLYAYPSIASASRDILRTEGLRGFFSGFGATAMRDAPYAGLYVLFYEQSKKQLGSSKLLSSSNGTPAAAVNFLSGVVAGAACSAVSNPFDAVKTRIQLQPGVYGNMWAAARMMVVRDGWRSLWDGLALRMGRKAMSSALAWTLYEELIRRAEVNLAEAKVI